VLRNPESNGTPVRTKLAPPRFGRTGRPMRGIVVIDSHALDDTAPDRWIGQARSSVAGLPPK